MRKLLSVVLAALLLFGLVGTAMAAGHGSITINNAVTDHTYTAYQIFSGTWDSSTSKLGDIHRGNGINDAGKTALYTEYGLDGIDYRNS